MLVKGRIIHYHPMSFAVPSGHVTHVQAWAQEMMRLGYEVAIIATQWAPRTGLSFLRPSEARLEDYDLVHTYGCNGLGLWGMRCLQQQGVKIVHTYTGTLVGYYRANPGHALRCARHAYFYRKIVKEAISGWGADAVTAVSRNCIREATQFFRVSPRKIHLVPNGFHPTRRDEVRIDALRRALNIPSGATVFLFVGRDTDPTKGAERVYQAFQRLALEYADVFLLCAPGYSVPAHERIRSTGELLHEELMQLYFLADVFVNTSRYDALPLTVLEAMGVGLPVIATAAGGSEDVIEDGVNGILLPRNARGLEASMYGLYRDVARRHRLGQQAALTARHYTWSASARQLDGVYQSLLTRRREELG